MQRFVALLRRYESMLALLVVAAGLGAIALGLVSPTLTCVTGDMQSRYHAHVPPALTEVYLDAARMEMGLGAAAVGGWEGLGDALAVDGRVFVRHTNRASPRYYQLTSNRYFQSNAFVSVPEKRAPHGYYRIDADTRMDRLLETLAREYPHGVMAAGAIHFAPLRSIAMSAAAIADKPVMQYAARYYTHPMENVKQNWAYVVLIAARDGADGALATMLPPEAVRTIPAGHALALRLRESPAAPGALPLAENAISVGQLLKDAVAVEGKIALYPIAHLSACAQSRATVGAVSH